MIRHNNIYLLKKYIKLEILIKKNIHKSYLFAKNTLKLEKIKFFLF